MLKSLAQTLNKRIRDAMFFEIEFSRVQRQLEQSLDDTLDMVPLQASRQMFRAARRRAVVVLKANLGPAGIRRGVAQAVEDSIEQIPSESSREVARSVRDQAVKVIDASLAGIPKIRHGLRVALSETVGVLETRARLARVQQELASVVDETIEQIPMETPKGIARIMRNKTTDVLNTDVGVTGIQKGLERTLNKTLEGMPLDPNLLVKQGADRGKVLNRQLAWSLAFVAGAVNAGGFLAVQTFTSHVTGVVSRAANEFVLGRVPTAVAALGVVVCFFAGAFCAGFLISLGRRHHFQAHYALSLMLEAVLLLIFGLLGATLHNVQQFFVPATVALLSFVMGMHNSVVTTISNAEVRTTHLTGIVTDMGLEFSRLLYFNVDKEEDDHMGRVMGNRNKLKLHSLILVSFFVGGLAGAVGFTFVGFKMTIFLAAFLFLLAWRPVLEDIRIHFRLVRQPAAE